MFFGSDDEALDAVDAWRPVPGLRVVLPSSPVAHASTRHARDEGEVRDQAVHHAEHRNRLADRIDLGAKPLDLGVLRILANGLFVVGEGVPPAVLLFEREAPFDDSAR